MSNGSSPFRPDDLQRYREASNALENTRSQVEALEQTATVETFNRQLDLLRRRLLNDPQAFRDMFISDGTAAIVAEFQQDELSPEFIRTFFAGEYADVIERYKLALFRAVPDVPKAEIVWRLHFMLGAMSYAIAGTDILQVITGLEINDISGKNDGAKTKSEAKLLAERLMPFLLGGLRAALPQSDEAPIQPPPEEAARSKSLEKKR